MSTFEAIAQVTDSLRWLLHDEFQDSFDSDLSGTKVTARTPDKAQEDGAGGNQVNVFLYHTTVNAAWANREPVLQVRPGERGFPPLALNLYYLITAYGVRRDDKSLDHLLLGAAMRVLHDNADLGAPSDQVESARITPLPMTVDEMSKLWTTFQTPYRISAAYMVSAVLIDSSRAPKSALPVFRRGQEDRGPQALASGIPTLTEAKPALKGFPSVRVGEALIIKGENLTTDFTVVRATNRSSREPVEIFLKPELGDAANEIKIRLGEQDDDGNRRPWTPGFYTACLVVTRPDVPRFASNEVSFALAPEITDRTPTAFDADFFELTITCRPSIDDDQKVVVLLGDQQFTDVDLSSEGPGSSTVTISGEYDRNRDKHLPRDVVVRLRVDGVDSIPIKPPEDGKNPEFDPDQMVTIS